MPNKKLRSLAVMGVDGTGKSSVLSNLQKILGNKCTLQYMGYRSFNNKTIIKLVEKNDKTIFEQIKFIILVYKELKQRVKKNSGFEGVVIYDRYVHEIYINAFGIRKVLYTILYRFLFPQPDAIVYLHCSVETSLSRKDDILDVKQFTQMKGRFDNEFIHNNKVLSLDSEEFSSLELTNKIIEHFQL